MRRKKILVCALNWGLGHASRSIPVVKALQKAGFEPIIGSDGEALLLLKKEFPKLEFIEFPSYGITYPKNGKFLKLHLLLKGPGLIKAIYAEKLLVKKLVSEEKLSGIISDNRLGAYSHLVPSVYITHQLKILSGSSTFFSSWLHQFFIRKFTECWVPDVAEKINLSGKMAHDTKIGVPLRFLGLLSRFQKKPVPKKYDLLVLLSGPEPQRGILERILQKELRSYEGSILFVKGTMEEKQTVERQDKMEIYNFLVGEELEMAINQSDLVLSRSGYSTIMDLAVLGKEAFFIPTPGQFEQEYLAERMEQLNIVACSSQENFSLEKLTCSNSYKGFSGYASAEGFSRFFGLFHGK